MSPVHGFRDGGGVGVGGAGGGGLVFRLFPRTQSRVGKKICCCEILKLSLCLSVMVIIFQEINLTLYF